MEASRATGQQREAFDGSLATYVRVALERSPRLRAAWHQYRADSARSTGEAALPDPTVSYAFFARPVETRVGPQRHKIGVSQAFPWPGTLGGKEAAARHSAAAARRRYEAVGFDVARNVKQAYWDAWLARRLKRVRDAQILLLKQLAMSARARLEVGGASLADVGQIELMRSRLVDNRSALDEAERRAVAKLRAALSVSSKTRLPVRDVDAPRAAPSEKEKTLQKAAQRHPRIGQFADLIAAQHELARASRATGKPTFRLGAEYIITGEARMPGTPDSGKDPIVLMLSATIPLWNDRAGAQADAADAQASSLRAKQAAESDQAAALVTMLLSQHRDQQRRLALYEKTLIPQAESVFESTLGGYQTGEGRIAPVLLAVRELLDLQLAIAQAEAAQAKTLAALEAVVGRRLELKDMKGDRGVSR